MNPFSLYNRRQFLKQANASALGGSMGLSTLFSLNLANKVTASSVLPSGTDSKFLVCIFLQGGMDGFHLLVPSDATRYGEYSSSRSSLALPQQNLIGLNEDPLGMPNLSETYGLHSSAVELAHMFNGTDVPSSPLDFSSGRRLSFISNVGTLIEPTTLEQFRSGDHPLPRALASHFDQRRQWQTSIPQGGQGSSNLTGWAGRLSDLLRNCDAASPELNISLSGNSVLQRSLTGAAFSLSGIGGGDLGLSDNGNTVSFDPQETTIPSGSPFGVKNSLHDKVLQEVYSHHLEENFADIGEQSVLEQFEIKDQINSLPDSALSASMNGSFFAQQLKDVLKIISARKTLGLRRQIFFVSTGNWDMHGGLLDPFRKEMQIVSRAIGAFQHNLNQLGLQDDVVGFSSSDFARTLRSNGRGSDHAWGGPQFVFGAPVKGGRIVGEFPDLTLGNLSSDIGRGGRILPTYSTDEYFAELLKWFGVSGGDLNTVLPNYVNFSGRPDLDFLI